MINVTKPFLPDFNEYKEYLEGIWGRAWLTNRGPLVTELEDKLKDHLGLDHLLFLANGTIAIQIAIKVLDLKGEILTTPFSYVATTTSILWENCKPVFVDVDPATFCIDPQLIEKSITPQTSAILATHVYGYPCDVEAIEKIARKHNLKVIYDAAHAFGVKYKGKSLFAFGDLSTCSFHATKVFHTGEGGAIISNDPSLNEKIFHYHTFGHIGDEYFEMGVNAKNSELHAAMGLCNIRQVEKIIAGRKQVSDWYQSLLKETDLRLPEIPADTEYNYAYFPVLFRSEDILLKAKKILAENGINTRRYFYPSLNELPYLSETQPCPVSEDASRRALCLPLYFGLTQEEVKTICTHLIHALSN